MSRMLRALKQLEQQSANRSATQPSPPAVAPDESSAVARDAAHVLVSAYPEMAGISPGRATASTIDLVESYQFIEAPSSFENLAAHDSPVAAEPAPLGAAKTATDATSVTPQPPATQPPGDAAAAQPAAAVQVPRVQPTAAPAELALPPESVLPPLAGAAAEPVVSTQAKSPAKRVPLPPAPRAIGLPPTSAPKRPVGSSKPNHETPPAAPSSTVRPPLAAPPNPPAILAEAGPGANVTAQKDPAPRESEREPVSATSDNEYLQGVLNGLHNDERSAPYKVLVSNLQSSEDAEADACVNLVALGTSSEAADIAVHVALLLAERARQGVLLIDADVTERILTKSLGADQRPGLIEVLNHSALWRQLVLGVSPHGVSLLPAGRGVLNGPGDDSSRWAALFEEPRQRYTYIVLVTNGDNEHVRELAAHSSASYLVVGLGQTDRRQVARTIQRLNAMGARVSGCVVTNV